jgi:DNA recombination protein RmuC
LQIEETAKDIIKRVEELGIHIGKYDQFMISLGKSLDTTVNKYNAAHKELKKIDKDVMRISGTAAGVEPLELPGPILEGEE